MRGTLDDYFYDHEDEAIKNIIERFTEDGEKDREPTEEEVWSELTDMYNSARDDYADAKYEEMRDGRL